jgi:hypothetical protein
MNYYYFLNLWWKYTEPIAKTFCYSLLPNHFHFFIRVENNVEPLQVSKAFSNLFNAYAKAINKKYVRTGSLFQERFRRKEVYCDKYFTKIICYILTNPAKHGYCENSLTYEHSAYRELVCGKETKLLRDEVFNWFYDKETFMNLLRIFDGGIRPNRSKSC